ncbi:MAG: magnesium transporter [Cytophagales bacterium]
MFEITKEYVESIKVAIEQQDSAFVKSSFEELYPADIAQVLYELTTSDCIQVINTLEDDFAAEVISYVDPDTRKDFLRNFDTQKLATFLKYIDSDDAVDIVNELPIKEREEVISYLEKVNKQTANNVTELLRYEADVAGGIMAKELVKTNVNWTVKRCIDQIRIQAEKIDRIFSVYVVDDEDKLLGIVSTKKLLLTPDSISLKDIYEPDIISVNSYEEVEQVADLFKKYDLEALPVVNVQGKLVGLITVDDVLDVVTEKAEKDIQAMSGISESIEEDDSVWTLTRARLPWLLAGMVGGLLGAIFIGNFEQSLIAVPAMAFFIPLITATGGNVGVQSSSLIVQSLASHHLIEDSMYKRLGKVLAVAGLNGLIICCIVFTFSYILGHSFLLGMVVSIALFSVILLASILGTITPILLDRVGVNPALASGPFITTANDLLGLGVYFSVAHMLLN